MDATMAALRLASSEGHAVDRVHGEGEPASAAASGKPRQVPTSWLNGAALPSKEVLLTLLWVLRVEERRLQIREQVHKVSNPGTPSVTQTKTPTNKMNKTTYVLKVLSNKRNRAAESHVPSSAPGKRRRFR